MMKRVLTIILAVSGWLMVQAQNSEGNYNPYVNSGVISPSPLLPIQVNGTGIVSFNFGNSGSDPLEIYTDQYITLTITLSYGIPDNINPMLSVGGTASGYFSWSYSSGTYTAIQTGSIPSNSSGTITIAYRVTQNSSAPGSNGFNVNITPAAYQTTSNTQNDDAVSSYTYTEIRDFGDAPLTYGSADHILDFLNYFGSSVDGESANQSSPLANGDDTNGQDDEDGVTFPGQVYRGELLNIPVTVVGLGRLNAWIDWNGNGDFLDPGEQIASNVVRSDGTANLSFTVPSNAIITVPTFARFRFTPGTLSSPIGSATGGEIEDYRITISCAQPNITLSSSEVDDAFCAGTIVTFTASGGINYNFRIAGATAQNGTLPTFSTSTLSNGQVVDVIVTDGNGCTANSAGIPNTVYPIPTAGAGPLTTGICQGSASSPLGGIIGGSATLGTWSTTSGGSFTPSATSLNATWLPPAAFSGIATLVLTTSGGECGTTSASKTQIVNPTPNVSITNPAAVCSPSTVNITQASITAGSTSGLVYSYFTDIAGTITYNTPLTATSGTYYIKGTLPASGCFDVKPVIVTVNPIPLTPIVSVVNNCNNTSTLSTVSTGNLLWNTGATTTQIIVNSPGVYSVTSTVNGCVSAAGNATAAPKTSPAAPTVSTTAPTNLCPSQTADLTNIVTSSVPAGGSILYKTTNNPLGTNVSNPSAVNSGEYFIFHQSQDGCFSSSTAVNASVNVCPPDLTSTLIVNPNIMHGITNFNLTVRVTELNLVNTNGTITINIPKDARWYLTDGYNPSLTILGSASLNNNVWNYSSDPINHIFTSTSVIPSGGFSTFGFGVTFNPESTRGVFTITSQVVSGGGGEIRVNNNADSESLDYFQE